MNFAFPTILIFLLCLPGILFRHGYLVGTWFGPTRFKTIIEELSLGLIYSLLLHMIWIGLADACFHIKVDYATLIQLLSSTKSQAITIGNEITQANLKAFGIYLLSLYMFAFLIGVLSQQIVRASRLDRIFGFIAPHGDSFYLMRGEVTFENITPELITKLKGDKTSAFTRWDLLDAIHNIPDPDIIIASVVVEMNSNAFIYMGYVNTWRLNSEGEIDKIVLSTTYRRNLENDFKSEKKD